jgi:hypothetical protein
MSSAVEKKFLCITPTREIISSNNTFWEFINSHNWDIDRTEYKDDGDQLLAQVHCARCGLDRVIIISDIKDSAKNASAQREVEKLHADEREHWKIPPQSGAKVKEPKIGNYNSPVILL